MLISRLNFSLKSFDGLLTRISSITLLVASWSPRRSCMRRSASIQLNLRPVDSSAVSNNSTVLALMFDRYSKNMLLLNIPCILFGIVQLNTPQLNVFQILRALCGLFFVIFYSFRNSYFFFEFSHKFKNIPECIS